MSHITAISIRTFYFALSPILYSGTQSTGRETQTLVLSSSHGFVVCQFWGALKMTWDEWKWIKHFEFPTQDRHASRKKEKNVLPY